MTTTIPKPTDRQEWLNLRRPYANASDAGVYMGCHPFRTLADLAVEKLTGEDTATNRAMDRGNRLEDAVAEWWAAENLVSVHSPQVMYLNGRVLATLDRRIDGNDTDGVEVKTTSQHVDRVEPYWWWQAQAQCHAADLLRVHFAVLDGSMDLACYTVERDDEAIAALLAEVGRVWSFLDLGMVPEGAEVGADHTARLYPQHTAGEFVEADDDLLAVVERWAEARERRLAAEKEEEAAKDLLLPRIAGAEGVQRNGLPVLTWRASKATTKPDWKALEADHPDLVAKYRREVPGARRLLPVKALKERAA